jgi:excinuclease ABC subunit C
MKDFLEKLQRLPLRKISQNEAPQPDGRGIFSQRFVGSGIHAWPAGRPPKRKYFATPTGLRPGYFAKGDKKKLPENPGIYLFIKDGTPVYIGKAKNLRNRVASYFNMNLLAKTERMVKESDSLSFIEVTSELESLLLEARLIRSFFPKYNIAAKDDKHPLYIIITREKYPRVITARKIDLNKGSTLASFGPFPSSGSVFSVLKMIRKIFPFSDHKIGNRGCLYSHIGLCSPCPSIIMLEKDASKQQLLQKKYLNNIRMIKGILSGKFEVVKNILFSDMEKLAKEEKFEQAAEIKNKIIALNYITQPQTPTEYFIENPNLFEDLRYKELENLQNILGKNGLVVGSLERIECFDVAHLAGTNPTASMVTFVGGQPVKALYRHFRILQKKGQSDTDSMAEVVKRRLKHLKDWGKPDLIIVDGGKAQVSVFKRSLKRLNIPLVGLAKRFETLVIPTEVEGVLNMSEHRLNRSPALNLVQRIRDEAHRFARRYHHKLIANSIKA